MRHVLDSNVAVKWVIPEAHSDKAIRIRDLAIAGSTELLIPHFFPYEVANVLSKAERPQNAQSPRLQPMEGARLLADVLNVPMRIMNVLANLARAYEISSQTRSSVFDCLYVALAEQEGTDFITADTRLVNNLRGQINIAIIDLATMP